MDTVYGYLVVAEQDVVVAVVVAGQNCALGDCTRAHRRRVGCCCWWTFN